MMGTMLPGTTLSPRRHVGRRHIQEQPALRPGDPGPDHGDPRAANANRAGFTVRRALALTLSCPTTKTRDPRRAQMIVLIDNYDSFTFNLFHYLGELGAEVVVHRNDKLASADVLAADPDAIVLSPGPCTPNEAGICLDLIERAAQSVPILGVCLGHQAIGQ